MCAYRTEFFFILEIKQIIFKCKSNKVSRTTTGRIYRKINSPIPENNIHNFCHHFILCTYMSDTQSNHFFAGLWPSFSSSPFSLPPASTTRIVYVFCQLLFLGQTLIPPQNNCLGSMNEHMYSPTAAVLGQRGSGISFPNVNTDKKNLRREE